MADSGHRSSTLRISTKRQKLGRWRATISHPIYVPIEEIGVMIVYAWIVLGFRVFRSLFRSNVNIIGAQANPLRRTGDREDETFILYSNCTLFWALAIIA